MKKKTYGKTRTKSCSFIKKVTGMVAAVSLAVGMIYYLITYQEQSEKLTLPSLL